jgi:hypothetical protein
LSVETTWVWPDSASSPMLYRPEQSIPCHFTTTVVDTYAFPDEVQVAASLPHQATAVHIPVWTRSVPAAPVAVPRCIR